ncbi:MAG: hypothetical protein J6V93_00465 [Clostridia bacterium]|nr:hypothetical protein [Clostridia bacterium]
MKKIALLLALILMLTPVLVACGGSEDDTKKEAPSISEEVVDTGFSLDNLRELDFGKQSFGIFADKGGVTYLLSEEETGDLVGDAVFQRNIAIEEKYNLELNIVEAEVNQPCAEIRNFIMADDKTYHMFINVQHNAMPSMILEGYFVDWNELEDLDYEQPYWNSRVARDINFGGKVYTMGGDLNLKTYNNTNCIMFNKALFDDLGIDYPYQDVYDYTWTIDKMIEIVKQGYADLDGNTEWNYDGDRIGFNGWGWEMNTAVYIGMGGKPVINDEDNMPVLNLNNERTIKIIDKMLELFDGTNAWSEMGKYGTHVSTFEAGRMLMKDAFITGLSLNRDSEFGAGLVPYPMLDEEQGEYNSRAANIAHLCYIPTTNNVLQDTGLILEAMSIESYNNLRPVYYDVTLNVKEAPDEETIDMVDMVLASSSYMYEGFIGAGDFDRFLKNKFNSFSSWYAGNEGAFKKKLNDMIEFYGA